MITLGFVHSAPMGDFGLQAEMGEGGEDSRCVVPSPFPRGLGVGHVLCSSFKKKKSVHLTTMRKLHLNNILLKIPFLWPARPWGRCLRLPLNTVPLPLFTP